MFFSFPAWSESPSCHAPPPDSLPSVVTDKMLGTWNHCVQCPNRPGDGCLSKKGNGGRGLQASRLGFHPYTGFPPPEPGPETVISPKCSLRCPDPRRLLKHLCLPMIVLTSSMHLYAQSKHTTPVVQEQKGAGWLYKGTTAMFCKDMNSPIVNAWRSWRPSGKRGHSWTPEVFPRNTGFSLTRRSVCILVKVF